VTTPPTTPRKFDVNLSRACGSGLLNHSGSLGSSRPYREHRQSGLNRTHEDAEVKGQRQDHQCERSLAKSAVSSRFCPISRFTLTVFQVDDSAPKIAAFPSAHDRDHTGIHLELPQDVNQHDGCLTHPWHGRCERNPDFGCPASPPAIYSGPICAVVCSASTITGMTSA